MITKKSYEINPKSTKGNYQVTKTHVKDWNGNIACTRCPIQINKRKYPSKSNGIKLCKIGNKKSGETFWGNFKNPISEIFMFMVNVFMEMFRDDWTKHLSDFFKMADNYEIGDEEKGSFLRYSIRVD